MFMEGMGADQPMLIAGLGNPGSKYEKTRHNVGFAVLRRFAEHHSFPVPGRECEALLSQQELFGRQVFLAQPVTFMNRSGRSILRICRKYNLSAEQVLVIHDDLDLPPWTSPFQNGR